MLLRNTLSEIVAGNDISIRTLAAATGLPYQSMLKKARKPIPGEIYDPDDTNYDELADYINEHLPDWDIKAVDWEQFTKRKGCPGSNLKDPSEIKVGDKLWLRIDHEVPYEIIYTTATHVVLMKEGTEEPLAWNWKTFFFKGPRREKR